MQYFNIMERESYLTGLVFGVRELKSTKAKKSANR